MHDLAGGVAVITGGASGIGFGMARVFARVGMKLVLADIESAALAAAATTLRDDGADVHHEIVDVADAKAVGRLADSAYSLFGKVTVVCNNAGVVENNLATWEYDLADWNWVLGINVMGVVHGVREFVPRMIDGGLDGHIVNTASLGGLISGTANPIYIMSKHAVVALTENLQNDFLASNLKLNASVLCPSWVRTNIVDADRNRDNAPALTETIARTRARFKQGIGTGLEPETVGEMVLDAIGRQQFYIHTDPDCLSIVRDRFDAIVDGKRPAASRIPNPKK